MVGQFKTMQKQPINVKISHKVFNPAYLPYLEDNTPTQIFFGGASAGKSAFVIGQRVVYDLLKGGRNYLILRNTAKTSRISTFNEVQQTMRDWKVGHLFHILKDTMTITCLPNNCQILFGGLDDVQKIKSIKPTMGVITDILVEEATEVRESKTIKELTKRLRGDWGKPKRLILLFNPILKSHWIYKEYFTGIWNDSEVCYQDDKLFILKTTYPDNKFLTKEDIDRLEDETDEYHRNVYLFGNWGTLGGVIFTNWRIDDLADMYDQFTNIKNGLDFGYSQDPMAYNRMHYDGKRKKIYILHEEHEHGLTNPEIADLISPVCGREVVTCDSAEPKSIKELQNHGIRAIGAIKGKDSVNHGIQFLQQHEIIIDRQCQETINEFELYQWAKLRDGSDAGKPVDKDNHSLDCIRYALEDEMASLRSTPRVAVVNRSADLRDERKEKPNNLKPGQTAIPIYVGSEIVGYDIIGTKKRRRGISLPPGIR